MLLLCQQNGHNLIEFMEDVKNNSYVNNNSWKIIIERGASVSPCPL